MSYLPWICALSLSSSPLCKFTRSSICFLLVSATLSGLFSMSLSAQSLSSEGTAPLVDFGSVYLCRTSNRSTSCSAEQTLTYLVTESGTLGSVQLVSGRSPSLELHRCLPTPAFIWQE